MTDEELQQYVDRYLGDRDPEARYSSFDYCFTFFQDHREDVAALGRPDVLHIACLELGFYLASWGMYARRSPLLRRSVKALERVVEAVVDAPNEIWDLDLEGYDRSGIALVREVAASLRRAFPDGRARDTLVTKAMLGVFGCVPAYDRFFRAGFGASTFGPKSLKRLGEFWSTHHDVIERNRVPTLDVGSGSFTERRYPQAKVVDMAFFVKGGGSPAVVDGA
jgi:hypothetical protein